MGVSLQRLDQLYKPDSFLDTLTPAQIAAIEAGATDFADVAEAIFSQFKQVIHGAEAGNWYDNIQTVHGGDASLYALYNRATLEGKNILKWFRKLDDIAVPAAQAYVLLAGATKPSHNIAIAGTSQGAVAAQLAGAIGAADLTEIAGPNTIAPKNLCMVFDATSGDPMTSSNRAVYALLQVGSAATDGNAFADSGNDQGQLTFVRPNATYSDLELCPAADIGGQSVIIAYTRRDDLADMEEALFRTDTLAGDPGGGVSVSLDSAYDGGHFMEVDGNDVDIRLANTKSWVFRAGSGGNAILTIARDDTTPATKVQVHSEADFFDSDAAENDFANHVKIDTAGQTINAGVTAGQIDSTSLKLAATAGDAELAASADVKFSTVRQTTALPLDDATTGAISALKTVFEGSGSFVSIADALKYAMQRGGVDLALKVTQVSGGPYNAGDNIAGATLDLTAYSIDMNTPATVNAFVFLNGRLVIGGNATTKNDVYVGTSAANGDLKHDFDGIIRTGDWLVTIGLKDTQV